MNRPAPETASIAAGVASALGASVCCVLPLVLVAIGVGGAWVAQLRSLERFYPVFVGLAIAAFAYAFYRLYLKPAPCAPDTRCATPVTRRNQRIEIGRASCRERVKISVGAGSLKKKNNDDHVRRAHRDTT